MILRKPYAFFIRYFRLINLVMSVLMATLIYQTFIIGRFLNKYIADYTAADNFVLSNYINFYSFLFCLLVIILVIIVSSVMFVKKKPLKLYVFNFIVAVSLLALYIIDYNVMKNIGNAVLDIRVSKAIRDVTFIVLGVQVLSFIITLLRTVGLDIKRFDFARDLKELEIDVKDNEEFEVAVEFDRNEVKRGFRKIIRDIKYVYFEQRFMINITVLILAIVICFIVVINKNIYSSNVNEGQIFTASGVQFNVENSYLTNTDQDGELITDHDKMLLAVRIDVKKLSQGKKKLNTGIINLEVGNNSYGKTDKYNGYVDDLGTMYINQDLTDSFQSYVLVFEIDLDDADKKMKLKINDNVSYVRGEVGAKNTFVKLKPIKLTKKANADSKGYTETINFSGSILGETTLTINKYEIDNKFKVPYNFCLSKDKCISSYEYVTPTGTGNVFKTLLKIEGNFDLDENMNIAGITDVYDLFNNFATVYYKLDDKETLSYKVDSKKIRPKVATDNSYYIEIDRDIMNAKSIYILFNVRNYSYKYVLK
ncbi:MAG: hypothetical protein IKE75_03090 [Bacilli bacterium]|nr:hypothetical protein [Bacilli bacterium]